MRVADHISASMALKRVNASRLIAIVPILRLREPQHDRHLVHLTSLKYDGRPGGSCIWTVALRHPIPLRQTVILFWHVECVAHLMENTLGSRALAIVVDGTPHHQRWL